MQQYNRGMLVTSKKKQMELRRLHMSFTIYAALRTVNAWCSGSFWRKEMVHANFCFDDMSLLKRSIWCPLCMYVFTFLDCCMDHNTILERKNMIIFPADYFNLILMEVFKGFFFFISHHISDDNSKKWWYSKYRHWPIGFYLEKQN